MKKGRIMKDIVIVGSGGAAIEVKYLIDSINYVKPSWNIIGFIDDWGLIKGTSIVDEKVVIGNIDDLNSYKEEKSVVIAIGRSDRMFAAVSRINNPVLNFPNLVHPRAEVGKNVLFGKGNIIMFSCFLSYNVRVDNFNLFSVRSLVGHGSTIGSFNIFYTNVIISGDVSIGNNNIWGLNSSIMQKKRVGNNNSIGACSFVVRDIEDNGAYFGCPAKINPLPVRNI
jgi:sugar O-acyltransferase (sialic acid O-acetyltransferase NeuD family)